MEMQLRALYGLAYSGGLSKANSFLFLTSINLPNRWMFFLVKYFIVTFSPIQLRSGKRLMIIELLFSLSVLTRKQ